MNTVNDGCTTINSINLEDQYLVYGYLRVQEKELFQQKYGNNQYFNLHSVAVIILLYLLDEQQPPLLRRFEEAGIVKIGYFSTRAKQIADGHRRFLSMTSELQQTLLENPSYNEELAQTLIQDLRSDSEEDDDYSTCDVTDDSDEFMDTDDEEQARKLQELEYKIGHRPSTDESIEKRILYEKISEMAPTIQRNTQQLQKTITKNKKRKKKQKRRRRPTMIDLEERGIVPSGYFDEVEQAMHKKRIRKENIVHDLTFRLQSRPEYSEILATKLMGKALHAETKLTALKNGYIKYSINCK